MHKRIWLVFALLLVLVMPSLAMAEEVSSEIVERNETMQLTAAPPTPLTMIQQVWRVPISVFGKQRYWYDSFALFQMLTLGGTGINPIVLAVVLVFLWWGVRKCIRMIFKAFRKGRING